MTPARITGARGPRKYFPATRQAATSSLWWIRLAALPHLSAFDLVLSIALGIGLAAAVGFRVFLPMLVMSVAASTGHLALGSGFAWLATPAALVMLSVATVLEILAYYIPGIDN